MDPFQDQRALRQDASLEPQWDRHPQVAGIMLQGLKGGGEMASANVARECVASLADAGCVLPSWLELVDGVRPPVPEDTGDPFQPRQGWQHFASNIVEEQHNNLVESDLMHHQYSLFVLEWNPGLVRRKHTNVFAAACGTFHAVILQEVMIMFRTSPISSLRILVTRTSPFCSTRKPSSPTLWFSPSRKTPQAMVRGAWSYSSFEACCDALHFLGHEGSHFSLYTSTMSLPRNVTLPLIFHDGFMGT